ncbi:MAG: YfhO family protein, partial [Bryobacteraceae bacterium]
PRGACKNQTSAMRRLLPVVSLLLISTGFYWKLLFTDQYTWLEHPDSINQVLPWLQMQARAWHHGEFALWSPHQWGGYPLVGYIQPGVLSPINWLLFPLALKHGFVQIPLLNGQFVLLHFLAMLFTYALCRDLGRSAFSSILGATLFGLSGYVGWCAWPQVTASAIWLPLVLLFALRSARGVRPRASAAVCGVLLAVSMMGTHHNIPLFAATVLGGFWLWYLAAKAGPRMAPAVFALCFALVAAVQILPALELGRLSVRWVDAPEPVRWNEKVPYTVHEGLSWHPENLPALVVPLWRENAEVFAGFSAILLAGLALACARHDRPVRILAAMAGGSLALALGGGTPVQGLLYTFVPMLDKARSPVMAIAVFHASIAPLAAFGLDWLRSASPDKPAYRSTRTLSLAAGAVLVSLITALAHFRPEARFGNLGLAAVGALALGGALAVRGQRWLPAAVLAATLLQIYPASTGWLQRKGAASGVTLYTRQRDLADFLRAQPGRPRVRVDEAVVPDNFGDWFGIDQLNGTLPALIEDVLRVHHEPRMLRLLSVRYWIGNQASGNHQRMVFESASGAKIFADDDSLPRTWIVHQTMEAANASSARDQITGAGFDPRSVATVEGIPPQLDTCGVVDDARLVSQRANSVEIEATLGCRGLLVASDVWYPGWRVDVDGESAPLVRVNGILRGVVLAAGHHRVVFRYRPTSFYAGSALALAGLFLCGAMFRLRSDLPDDS